MTSSPASPKSSVLGLATSVSDRRDPLTPACWGLGACTEFPAVLRFAVYVSDVGF
jgi:hypothetical protein